MGWFSDSEQDKRKQRIREIREKWADQDLKADFEADLRDLFQNPGKLVDAYQSFVEGAKTFADSALAHPPVTSAIPADLAELTHPELEELHELTKQDIAFLEQHIRENPYPDFQKEGFPHPNQRELRLKKQLLTDVSLRLKKLRASLPAPKPAAAPKPGRATASKVRERIEAIKLLNKEWQEMKRRSPPEEHEIIDREFRAAIQELRDQQ
jgi:hypothetical protein